MNNLEILELADFLVSEDNLYDENDVMEASDTLKELAEFKANVYELAFGDEAIHKGYSDVEVLIKLHEMLQTGVE